MPAVSDLQFDKAEYPSAAPAACAFCHKAISDEYFTINGRTSCRACHTRLSAFWNEGTPASRFFTAAGLGLLGALAGAGIYYAVRAITGYELGLVAIVVGLLVGKGVRRGARGRGGAGYQTLAIALTYLSIAMNYIPEVVQALQNGKEVHGLLAVIVGVMSVGLILISPILVGVHSPIGLLITGIALYEAWKINKRVTFEVSGPHAVAAPAPPPSAEPPPPSTETPPAADGHG
jgi:hypothetical protein